MFKPFIGILAAVVAFPGAALAAPVLSDVTGAVYDLEGATIANLDAALSLIEGEDADARFTVSALDYPNGSEPISPSETTLVSEFLGADAASLTGRDFTLEQSVFVFSGQILLEEGAQTFTVASDDGFRLMIGDALISEALGPRGFTATSATVDAGVGLVSFMLVFYNDLGEGGIEFRVDGEIAEAFDAEVVPLPGALALMAPILAGGALVRRQRRP